MEVQDGWWTAVGEQATFTFMIANGKVRTAPPYGWSLLGRTDAESGLKKLERMGFVLHAPEFMVEA